MSTSQDDKPDAAAVIGGQRFDGSDIRGAELERARHALAYHSPSVRGGTVGTTDIARGRRVAAQMGTGMVFINDTVISAPDLPFGGVKNSRFGREPSDLGMHEFINKKLVTVTAA